MKADLWIETHHMAAVKQTRNQLGVQYFTDEQQDIQIGAEDQTTNLEVKGKCSFT